MRRLATFAAVLAVSVLGSAPASAAGQICYDLNVNVNGPLIAEADCLEV